MDPLSEVIRQSRPRSITVGATDVGGDVAIQFPAHEGAFLYCVESGTCWLQVQGDAEGIHMHAGDCFMLPSGRPFVMASDLALPPVDAAAVFDGRPNGSVAAYNGGGRCMMFAAHFEFDGGFSRFLFSELDTVVRVKEPEARATLREAIDQMIDELQRGRPGCEVVVDHLAHIALVKILRFHLAEVAHARPGWLYALADSRMGAAISAMHDAPSQRWTVASLAGVSAMSRTAFATRFKTTVGHAPMDYLTKLRMLIAAKRLAEPRARVSVVARELGYESESSFSAAFKRAMGLSPRRYTESAGRHAQTTEGQMSV
ncbi:AraC family transcriptional regulator [Thiomonas intermedia]|uniref:AraC family transcriptional regulator n=1 Tax=Thiomonas intermedia TaxID=926 RepID=UPI0009A4DA5D|nr:AraC family transcriptional regulator [Thiomonas intermedia]